MQYEFIIRPKKKSIVRVCLAHVHCRLLIAPLVPSLEPEFVGSSHFSSQPYVHILSQKSPILDEHHLFTDHLHKLEEYLEELTGFHADAVKGPIPTKNEDQRRLLYDGNKIAVAIENIAGPMLTHVGSLFPCATFEPNLSLDAKLENEIGYLDGAKLRECGLPLSKLEAWETYEKTMVKGFVSTVTGTTRLSV